MATPAWEYRVISVETHEQKGWGKSGLDLDPIQTAFNDLGGDGWELVAVNQVTAHGSITGNAKGLGTMATFKRAPTA